MRRWIRIAGAALPAVALSVAGLFHPTDLTPATAPLWWQLHVVLLPVFPLLAVVLWGLLHGSGGPAAAAARVAAYVFAVFYTGLDALAGIAAGVVVDTTQRGSQAALDLIALGNDLAMVGVVGLLVATVLTGVVLVRRHGGRALAGAALLVASALAFAPSHVYWPVGGLGLLGFALGSALLAAVVTAPAPVAVPPG